MTCLGWLSDPKRSRGITWTRIPSGPYVVGTPLVIHRHLQLTALVDFPGKWCQIETSSSWNLAIGFQSGPFCWYFFAGSPVLFILEAVLMKPSILSDLRWIIVEHSAGQIHAVVVYLGLSAMKEPLQCWFKGCFRPEKDGRHTTRVTSPQQGWVKCASFFVSGLWASWVAWNIFLAGPFLASCIFKDPRYIDGNQSHELPAARPLKQRWGWWTVDRKSREAWSKLSCVLL